jgi:hypothetical protein
MQICQNDMVENTFDFFFKWEKVALMKKIIINSEVYIQNVKILKKI